MWQGGGKGDDKVKPFEGEPAAVLAEYLARESEFWAYPRARGPQIMAEDVGAVRKAAVAVVAPFEPAWLGTLDLAALSDRLRKSVQVLQ